MAYNLKITLLHIHKPPVWRELEVPEDILLVDLHLAIQGAFGWDHAHLFQFETSERVFIGIPDGAYMENDARKLHLNEFLKKEGDKLLYEYDFGDSWQHLIELTSITDKKKRVPSCTAGKGMTPPEDVGGVPGYERFKEVISDRRHEEYHDMREWMGMETGEYWDPAHFSKTEANEGMKHYRDHRPQLMDMYKEMAGE